MPYPTHATGYVVKSHNEWSSFHKEEFPLKPFESYDIDIAVEACGVCGSDVHSITGGWGEKPLPLCVGHEIVGRAIKVGDKVTTVKVGDRVGVGAQIGADLNCVNCKDGQENYCPNAIDTYGSEYPDGTLSQGGYSSHVRAHEIFTFKIPDNIESSIAAPMLCAGITVYSPLVRNNVGPGKKVAIVGIGGLGHFALLWAKCLGAEVYALSHSPHKKDDALSMGAQEFVWTGQDGWAEPLKFRFDLILNTADAIDRFHLPTYFSTLKVQGKFHNVGFGDKPLPTLMAQDFAPNGCYIGASHIGNREEMFAMLDLASRHNVKGHIETIDISEEGCKEAVTRVFSGDVRYRFTLIGFDKAFGKRA